MSPAAPTATEAAALLRVRVTVRVRVRVRVRARVGLGLALTLALTLTRTLTLTCELCEGVEAEPARRQCAALCGRQPGGDLDEQIIGLDAVTEKGVTGWHGL